MKELKCSWPFFSDTELMESYRDQSIDLHSWFPYDRNLRHERVKVFMTIFLWYNDTELMESFCLLDSAM